MDLTAVAPETDMADPIDIQSRCVDTGRASAGPVITAGVSS